MSEFSGAYNHDERVRRGIVSEQCLRAMSVTSGTSTALTELVSYDAISNGTEATHIKPARGCWNEYDNGLVLLLSEPQKTEWQEYTYQDFSSSWSSAVEIAKKSVDDFIFKSALAAFSRVAEKYSKFAELVARIEEINRFSIESGDSSIAVGSLKYFTRFIESYPEFSRPELALLDNGNIQAEWDGAGSRYLILEFIPDGGVNYGLLTDNADYPNRTPHTGGLATLRQIVPLLRVVGIDWCLNE